MRRHISPAEKELRQLVRSMNANSPRTYTIATRHAGYYKGSPRYQHCLAELIGEEMHKRTAWKSSYAAVLNDIRRRVERHAA